MKELWLNFKDEKGEAKRVLVEGEKFFIGRTPDNDLQIAQSSLSRQHAKIERFADVFVVSDCGSSNGTTLNSEPLEQPVALKHNDKLNLGNAIDIEVEIPSEAEQEDAGSGSAGSDSDENKKDSGSAAMAGSSASEKSTAAASSSTGSSGSMWLLMLAPILMILVLIGLGGAILIARSKKEADLVKKEDDFIYSQNKKEDDSTESDDNKTTTTQTPTPTPTTPATNGNTGGTSTNPTNSVTPITAPSTDNVPTPKVSADAEKIKFASASFLRKIAFNDPRAFLLDNQVTILNSKINQFKGSGALAANIKNARKNSAQIIEMAKTKNLKPQFIANAALTKLGNQTGDVLATAQSMLDVLDNLSVVLGNELADDNLLVIASYSQGVAGQNLAMRDKVANLTKKFPGVTSRMIRTIWFLKDNGELTASEFDFALQFLAIGTITQNPKDFNVQADALVF